MTHRDVGWSRSHPPHQLSALRVELCLVQHCSLRRAQASKVKANRCYSYQDAADALDVSYVTVRSWVRQGLTVMADARPVLILGNDLKEFLTCRNARRRRSLASGELYCFTCKAARLPKDLIALYRPQSPRSGRLEPTFAALCSNASDAVNASIRCAHPNVRYRFGVP